MYTLINRLQGGCHYASFIGERIELGAPQLVVEDRGFKTTDSTTPRCSSRSSVPCASRPHFGVDLRVSWSLIDAQDPSTFSASEEPVRWRCLRRGPINTPWEPALPAMGLHLGKGYRADSVQMGSTAEGEGARHRQERWL